MEELLEQVVLIIATSGIPVLLANLAKNFIPKMQGKTDKIVNAMIVGLFVFGWFYGEYYDPNFLYDVLPGISIQAKEVVEIINGILILVASLWSSPKIYALVKDRVPLLGKSFSGPKG